MTSVRLHGVTVHDYHYTDADLIGLRERVRRKATYILFNNNYMRGDAPRFIDLVKGWGWKVGGDRYAEINEIVDVRAIMA